MHYKRLYFNTGKGGVGKSTISMAMANCLLKKGEFKVSLFYFDQLPDEQLIKTLSINTLPFFKNEYLQNYIQKKLGYLASQWITKVTFFKALTNILPVINYIIFLDHVIDMLEEDPDLIVIFDSPSTGHTLIMLKSIYNFKKIFKVGPIYQDINRIHKFVSDPDLTKINICSTPSEMPLNESLELRENINSFELISPKIYVNNSFSSIEDIKSIEETPDFLRKKIKIESDIIDKYRKDIFYVVPHITVTDYIEIIKRVSNFMEYFL